MLQGENVTSGQGVTTDQSVTCEGVTWYAPVAKRRVRKSRQGFTVPHPPASSPVPGEGVTAGEDVIYGVRTTGAYLADDVTL